MKKLNLLFGILIGISFLSCSSDSDGKIENEPNFNPKLLKQITDNDGYWRKYFYNENDQIELTTRTSNQITLDSTYYFYNGSILSKTLQRIHVPVTGIVNTELIYNQFTSTIASGTYKIFKDDGTVFQDKTFEFTFSNHLFKSITFFNLDGTKSQEKTYTHDENGNLTKWDIIWYNPDGTIQTEVQDTFSKWDTSGLKTQSLFSWNYSVYLPDIYLSNNNCLNRIENGQTFNYSFEYDADGNVTKYNSIDEQILFTLEYYQ